MFNDVMTVIWKERKSLFRYRGSRTRYLLTLMSPIFLAVVLPWNEGAGWANSFLSLLLSAIIPVLIVGITIPDSFAGERERHTLGTLLASRLPDRAVLLGKFATGVAFAWGVTLVFLLVSLVTVNLREWGGEPVFFEPVIAVGNLTLSFLLATLSAGTGVIVSVRSATVQEATQTLMAIFFVPLMILQVVSLLFLEQIIDSMRGLNGEQVLLIVLLLLVLLNAGVLAVAMSRFQRSRLVRD